MFEPAAGVLGGEAVEDGGQFAVEFVETARADGAQRGCDLGPAQCDRIEIGSGSLISGIGLPEAARPPAAAPRVPLSPSPDLIRDTARRGVE